MIDRDPNRGSEAQAALKRARQALPLPGETSPQRQAGFNYGIGNRRPTPETYGRLDAIATGLRQAAMVASDKAWQADMALRAWRLAETDAEADAALVRIENLIATHTGSQTWPEGGGSIKPHGDTSSHLFDGNGAELRDKATIGTAGGAKADPTLPKPGWDTVGRGDYGC